MSKRGKCLLTGAALVVGALACTSEAAADNMDPALGRLVIDERCRTGRASYGRGDFYNPASGFNRCLTNDAAFGKLIAQYGAALAPVSSHAARTTGFGGFRIGFQGAYTTIDSDAHYWKQGTQGAVDSASNLSSISNLNPDGVLQTYALRLAKGFPFGVELGAGFGYLANTNIVAGGGDVRLALLEGFRDNVPFPGFLPDVGVGGAVRTITGTSEFKLTVASFDAEISKPFPIAGTVVLQPRVGYQWLRIFGDSGQIDLTPNTDPVTACGYSGDNNPATPDPTKTGPDGQPVCSGSSADFNNNVVFDKVRLTRHRINFGAQIRYQMVYLGVSAITDLISPLSANDSDEDLIKRANDPNDPSGQTLVGTRPCPASRNAPNCLHSFEDDPRTEGDDELTSQWTIAVEVGALF
jgi:hypothetical protein